MRDSQKPSEPTQPASAVAAASVTLPAPDADADLSGIAKQYVIDVKARLCEQHRAGAGGGAVVVAYTSAIDALVGFLFESATLLYQRRSVMLDHKCTVAAQGGYGRFELNPASDIDLLVLYPWKVNPYVETVAEVILYTLWDAGLTVGHASRTPIACARMAQRDLTVKTALLDARYLAGDEGLYREFEKTMESDVLKKNAAGFYREKLAESKHRHQAHGNSVYLLEPNLKDGPGGLRDIHTAMWLAKVKFKIKTVRDLVQKAVITEREEREIAASLDFLFRVRNALHFATGSHHDRLSFEFQEGIAAELGFGEAGERETLVEFMRAYYRHATTVRRFSDRMIERCTERAHPYRLLGRVTGREVREGVRVANRTLSIRGAELLEDDPSNLVTLFRDAQRHGVVLTEATKLLIREHLDLIGDAERCSESFTRPFLDIAAWRHDVWETFREMHAVGVLCRMFPEFARIDRLVQRDLYHTYTVDEHSLVGIAELERLRRGDHRSFAPLLTDVMRDLDRHDVLFLSMLFHDIGKGHGEGHSERGAELLEGIMARLPIHEDDAAQWTFLVRHHLLMSHLAQHRDTRDPGLLRDFAQTVGSVDNLNALYVMTFADMRAVAPKVWNNWRGELLAELYMNTMALFEQGQLDEDQDARAARVQRRVRATIEPERRDAFDRFLAAMPERYAATTPEARIPQHFEMMNRLREEWTLRPESEHQYLFVARLRHLPESEYSEFSLCTPDRPGLFAMVAGVVAAQGMNVSGGRITTSLGGVAFDVMRITHLDQRERVLDDDRWDRVKSLIAQALRGQVEVAELVASSRQTSILEQPARVRVETQVIADNDISESYTVLDVITQDRVGVLFVITHCLHQLGVVIHLAKITTQVHQVFDVFYVTDGDGAKILASERQDEIRAALIGALATFAAPAETAT